MAGKVDPDQNSHPNEVELTVSLQKHGRFVNPWPAYKDHGFTDLVKLMTRSMSTSRGGLPTDRSELDDTLPVMKPSKEELQHIPESGLRVTWLGHACVLVQFDGYTILTDPIFSQRCSPFQFIGPKRYRESPCTVDDLPKIDVVIISHNHYDHLDYHTVLALNNRFGDALKWYVPLGIKHWLDSCHCTNVEELDWWEERDFGDIKIVCTPCQHFSNRALHDRNKTLWSSWVIKGPSQSFYFGGDTGYCDVFKQIGRKYGPFDLAAIPIGAYEPRWFMGCIHVDPEEAVLIHRDVMAKRSLGIHWGTFILTTEPYLEPVQKLKESLRAQEIPEDAFFVLNHGQSKCLS